MIAERSAACVAIAVMFLEGCTSLTGLEGTSRYGCKAPDGVTCDSVSGVYANAIQGNLPSQAKQPPASPSTQAFPTPASVRSVPGGMLPGSADLRSAPRVLRLWFKAWEDADQDLFDQGYVYVQVDPGRWQVDHVQRRARERFAPIKATPQPRTSPTAGAGPVPDRRLDPREAPPPLRPALPRPQGAPTDTNE